jgi:acetoin utilization protein AcuC
MFNLGEGLHHTKENKASGFCVFSDIVVVGKLLQKENGIKRIATIDIDGHHGVRTQEIL